MRKKFYFSAVCLLAASSFMLVSCDKDEKADVTKPEIKLNAPKEGAVLKIGDKHGVHFDMDLSDDVMLKSYLIEIHSNFELFRSTARKDAAGILSSPVRR